MALPNISFANQNGALGNLNIGADSTSVLYFHELTSPFSSVKYQAFLNIKQVEAAGITKGDANYGVVHYHALEFFRTSANGAILGICFGKNVVAVLYDALVVAAKGEVRQVGVFSTSFPTSVTNWQTFSESLEVEGIYNTVFIEGGYAQSSFAYNTGIATNKSRVAIVGAGCYDGVSAQIAESMNAYAMSSLGAVLGLCAKAKVHECIGWVNKFNLSDGIENEKVKLFDGQAATKANTELIDGYGYLVMMKHTGIFGTFLSNSKTLTDPDDDYAYIERHRTMGKAKRLIRKALLPSINSPLYVSADGKLSVNTVKEFEGYCNQSMTKMQGAGEVSAYRVSIDANQNVLATNTLYIQLEIVPVGVARNIVVNIGFALSVNP
jgi:hypothetical protein